MVGKTLASAGDAEPRLRIYLAGGTAIHGANDVTLGERAFAGRQGRRLFCRLAAFHEPVPSVELADDLWGPDWPETWQLSLRSLVSKLRATLARVDAGDLITSAAGTYAIQLPANAWLDLDEAAKGIHRAEAALSRREVTEAAADALAARAIASRPLLAGEDGEWLDVLRDRLAGIRLRALECLGEVWIAHGDPALAARDAVEAIRVDPYRESAHRLLIRAHIAAGDRGAAARAYEACRVVLHDELGVAPSGETVALAMAVLKGG
jgi:DNA-binding SARP family transcriptional activator